MSPNKPATPLRNVRVDDELWDAAKEAAEQEGETVSDVIRRSLAEYAEHDPQDKDQSPSRHETGTEN